MATKKPRLSQDEFRVALADACETAGGQGAWASSVGLSKTYVSDVINGRRAPGPEICKALGYERQETYVPKDIWEQEKP